MTEADVAYIHANYLSLEQACVGRPESPDDVRRLIAENKLPKPSYVLPDGTEMVPADYFLLADVGRDEFARRFRGAGGDPSAVDEEWQGYLSGAYGVCLKEQTAENIARKELLVTLIEGLLDGPQPGDAAWRDRLRALVEELDALERPFAPDYDRARWGPSSRDRCITASRERFPDVFAEATVR
jgi:sugar phosphate isomerase/epimerase